ncbi:DUF6584 family protein [Bernardetia sp. OM2101]|uniref:DUF6584 family protein n=1 Tax=Bernardetia sp. OM2101 TaxID=3344876 RepID=UPI0035D08B84
MKKHSTKERLFWKVDNDLANDDLDKATSRLESSLQFNILDTTYRKKLGNLYLQKNNFIKAGKYFYLLENKSEVEQEAIKVFEKRFGNDAILICKNIITQCHFSFSRLSNHQKSIFRNLLLDIHLKFGITPNFLKGLERHLNK